MQRDAPFSVQKVPLGGSGRSSRCPRFFYSRCRHAAAAEGDTPRKLRLLFFQGERPQRTALLPPACGTRDG